MSRNRYHFICCISVCLAVILLFGSCSADSFFLKIPENDTTVEGTAEKTKVKKGTVKFENGDHLYIPGEDEMVLDKEAYVIFYKNLLSVYTFETLTEKQIKALCKEVDGELAGQISGAINMLQLKVDAADYDTLAELSEKLMELPEVMYATYEYPMEISENTPEDVYEDTNPWKNGKKKNDWWATAIHARGAWELSDIKEDIRVGVIDSGFDTDHDDLGTLHFLSSYPDNTESDHGTHVAGLIAAQDNKVGIRGIADTAELYCVDWSPYTNDEKVENYVNYINSHEYTEIINQLVEDYDVKVINNSWGLNLYSEKAFKEKLYGKQSLVVWLLDDLINDASDVYNKALYDEYLKTMENEASKSSEECLELMVQLLLNDKDVLIVQAAGNGYDNGGSGYDASRIGDFCGITQETFDSLSLNTKNKLAAKGISLKNIREHIIVVGAYENTTDDNGNYKMCSFSNFGATVDICAPGQDILSTVCDDKYDILPGTSMAAPIISGCAALLWQNSPELTAGEIKKLLVESTDVKAVGVTGSDSGKLYPTVNIENAIFVDLYTRANQFYSGWLSWSDRVPVDENDTIQVNGLEYARVVSDQYKSVDDLADAASEYFSEEIYKDIILSKRYTMIDGKLYAIQAYGEYGGDFIDMIEFTVTDATQDSCKITRTTYYENKENGQNSFTIKKINGKWLFVDHFFSSDLLYSTGSLVFRFS